MRSVQGPVGYLVIVASNLERRLRPGSDRSCTDLISNQSTKGVPACAFTLHLRS